MKNYVQIGTNNGNDSFKLFVQTLEERANIFLIEPNSGLINDIHESYKHLKANHNIVVLNNGIVHEKNFTNTIFVYDDPNMHALSSIVDRKSFPFSRKSLNFFPLTFSEFCSQYNVAAIELLCIDTEGYDYSILDSINFDEIQIKVIECEKWPYDEDSSSLIKTGPSFFQNYLLPKMTNRYSVIECTRDGMTTHLFTLK